MLTEQQSVDQQVREYEERLRKELGLGGKEILHFKRPEERPFTAADRLHTTILYGGLTLAHEEILQGALEGLGYRVRPLPCPDNVSLAVGKEFGNRGQCNPTYYTVGNLVKYLKELRDRGEQEIEDRYVFVTAGACGPCRFGMYEAEYRKALQDAGFPRFRVLLFQQGGSLSQSAADAGIVMNLKFFVALLKGMMAGDLLNDLAYKIRPYETDPGQTDRVLAEARALLADTLRRRTSLFKALRRARGLFAAIPVDPLRVKPKVKITGEFWAMTTEGDGNYRMMRWLEGEGAEVHVEPVATWIEYLIWAGMQFARDRRGVPPEKHGQEKLPPWKLLLLLKAARGLFRLHYDLYRLALGWKPDPLPSQRRLAEYARAYYDTHLSGGEGHLEVGKNIMAVVHKKAHMVLSLKPFGCMPSTQSDGVQSKVVSDFKEAIFLPIETSGDSEINAKSRVQMKLYEAKQRVREEVQEILQQTGLTMEEARAYVQRRPRWTSGLRRWPHRAASTAGNVVWEISRKLHTS